ncbi:MAG: SurA N-terminal domain-containing protein [Pseudomonadota bacterium]|nr:SurA N-terminal domain-containing protein [Pseudomonadota bacterium]
MLQSMREQARGVFGYIIVGAIVLVLSIFGFGALNFFVTSEPVIAEIGESEITESAYLNMVERQRRAQLAQLPDPSLLNEDALRAQVLEGMIERTLLLEAARSAGLGAPEPALDAEILRDPNFLVDGRFDADRFRIVLAGVGMTPLSYREALGEDLLVRQLAGAIDTTGFSTEAELRAMASVSRQERDVAWMNFLPEEYSAQIEPDDADLEEHYDAFSGEYFAPEQVTVQYLRLDRFALAAEERVDEAELLAAYDAEVEAFVGQERRRSSHILLSLDDDRDEAAAIELATALRSRVEAGESFAELAEAYSDDPGSAAQGGDLGFAVRGTFVPPFERALFALQVGELSAPVVSQFGVHLIRLEEVAQTDPPSLARMRPTLEQQLRDAAAQARFDDLSVDLETLAYEWPDLAEPAAALGLEVQTAGPFSREGGEGDFAVAAVIDAAFSDEVLARGYNSQLLQPSDGVQLVLRVVDHEPERILAFEEVRERVRDDFVLAASTSRAQADAQAVVDRLADGGSVSGIAAEYEREWEQWDGLTRSDRGAPAPVVRAAFSAARPSDGSRTVVDAALAAGGVAVVAVTAVRPGDYAALTEVERDQLQSLLQRRYGGSEFELFRGALRRDLGVVQRADDAFSGR